MSTEPPLVGQMRNLQPETRTIENVELYEDHDNNQDGVRQSRTKALILQLNDWSMESFSWFISVACIVVLVLVLQSYDQKDLSQWPSQFTINSFISALTTIAQMALMMPLSECISQLKWLWFYNSEKTIIDFETFDGASRGLLGCLKFLIKLPRIKLATAAVVTSIVAIAASPFTQQVVNYPSRQTCVKTAVLARAENYTLFERENPLYDFSVATPTMSMKAAVYNGLFTNTLNAIPPLPPTCATGNCTWAPFRSLAVCAQIANISDKLNNTVDDPNRISWALPNGAALSFFRTNAGAINVTNFAFNTSIAFPSYANVSIANFAVIADYSFGEGTNVTAIECLLHFCVKEFKAQVVNGNLVSQEWDINHVPTSSVDNRIKYGDGTTIKDANGDVYNGRLVGADEFNANLFIGSSQDGSTSTDVAQQFSIALFSPPQDMELVRITMNNIAESMSNNIRNYGDRVQNAIGDTCINTIFIQVRWAYMSLLIALSTASGWLLMTVIMRTMHLRMRGWKSSSLPILNSLDRKTSLMLRGGSDIDAVTREAKEVKVRLRRASSWEIPRLENSEHV